MTNVQAKEKILKILITPKISKPIMAVSDIRMIYKDEVNDLLILMLDFAEEIVGEDEFYEPGFSTNNKLRRNQRQRIEELRKNER